MRFLIEKVVPLKPKHDSTNSIIPQAEYTFKERATERSVRVIWPHDQGLKEGDVLPMSLEAGVLAMFHELFENPINEPCSVSVKLTGEQLEFFDKLKDANPPEPRYFVICMSGEPCVMPYENFGDERIGHQFRIDAQCVVNRLDKIKVHPDDFKDDHPKPAMCGPHRVVPYCPVLEESAHDEAARSGPGETAPG